VAVVVVSDVAAASKKLHDNLELVIYGKSETVTKLIVSLFCGGHVLFEDIPGTGKTTLARALAKSIDCDFKRIQFAPDLLPSDVTGSSIFNMKSSEFEYRPGPVTTNILLADEINRATPRTQAALLESMEERQVTVDGVTHPLPRPFMVLATQNPIELEGTFPLPEAQIDRFFMRLSLGYPDIAAEEQMILSQRAVHPIESVTRVLTGNEILELQHVVRGVAVHDDVRAYILDIVRQTREWEDLALGASPRASLALYRASQAFAAVDGRDFVIPDDVKAMAEPVIRHRLVLSSQGRLNRLDTGTVVRGIVEASAAPVEPLAS
jgi:MoxR-like ATPase